MLTQEQVVRLLDFIYLALFEGPIMNEAELIERVQDYAQSTVPELATEPNIQLLLYTPLATLLGFAPGNSSS